MVWIDLKDPLIRTYLVLGVLLVPMIVLLAEQYPSYDERMRRAAGAPHIRPLPAMESMRAQLEEEHPDVPHYQWRLAYDAHPDPRTGIAQVYDMRHGMRVTHRFLVIRHDIACGVCRDILAGLLYDESSGRWAGFVLFEPFERKGSLVDAGPFLEQFSGRSVGARFVLGETIDGITGATSSVTGFINRLHEAGDWLAAHPVRSNQVAEAQQ